MSAAIRSAIFTKLSATSGVTNVVSSRIYYQQAPADAAYPMVIFNKQAGTKTRAFQTPNAFNREVWLIKCVDRNTLPGPAETVAAAIDTAFDNGTITVSGKKLADLTHVGDVDYLEPVGDQQYRHHGKTFAVITTAS